MILRVSLLWNSLAIISRIPKITVVRELRKTWPTLWLKKWRRSLKVDLEVKANLLRKRIILMNTNKRKLKRLSLSLKEMEMWLFWLKLISTPLFLIAKIPGSLISMLLGVPIARVLHLSGAKLPLNSKTRRSRSLKLMSQFTHHSHSGFWSLDSPLSGSFQLDPKRTLKVFIYSSQANINYFYSYKQLSSRVEETQLHSLAGQLNKETPKSQ